MMQLRVKSELLTLKDTLWFHGNKSYTGIAFFTDEDNLLAKYIVNGIVDDEYVPLCLPDDINTHVVIKDANLINVDGEIAILASGEMYTGIVIWFDDLGHSYAEDYYEDGVLAANISWNNDMTVRLFHLDHGGVSESGERVNGELSYYGVNDNLFLRFNTQKEIEYISIHKNFFNLSLVGLLKFLPIKNINEIFKWKFSKSIGFSGQFINNSYIDLLFENNRIQEIESLIFYEVDIGEFGFILNLPKIKEIRIFTDNLCSKSSGREINSIDLLESKLTHIMFLFKKNMALI